MLTQFILQVRTAEACHHKVTFFYNYISVYNLSFKNHNALNIFLTLFEYQFKMTRNCPIRFLSFFQSNSTTYFIYSLRIFQNNGMIWVKNVGLVRESEGSVVFFMGMEHHSDFLGNFRGCVERFRQLSVSEVDCHEIPRESLSPPRVHQ